MVRKQWKPYNQGLTTEASLYQLRSYNDNEDELSLKLRVFNVF